MEATEEAKASDAVKSLRNGWHADGTEFLIEPERRDLNAKMIHGVGTDERAAKRHGRQRDAAAVKAVIFIED
jgi:hypothetical protein